MLFASTSPSYLMLDSLDKLNPYLSEDFSADLNTFICKIKSLKDKLSSLGFSVSHSEPMKITILAKEYGYLGTEISDLLSAMGIISEFADRDYLVLMPSPKNTDRDMERLFEALSSIKRREQISSLPPSPALPRMAMSIREALMSDREVLPVSDCLGRAVSSVTLGCPPAIPIAAPGEIIDENVISAFEYYDISECAVVK